MQSRSAKPFARFILRPWALGVVFAALLFSLLFILYGPRYLNGGDAVILRAFMGYGGGEPATFHLYTHTALAWLLYALAGLLPDIAWFSVVQLVLLYLACAVLIKSFAQIARHSLRARRAGRADRRAVRSFFFGGAGPVQPCAHHLSLHGGAVRRSCRGAAVQRRF